MMNTTPPPIPPASNTDTSAPSTATASLVLGILGLFCCGPFTSIPAIICGHKAKSKISKSQGTMKGEGLALAGLIMGYVNVASMIFFIPLLLAIAIPSFVKARSTSQANACIHNLRILDSAKEQWALEKQKTTGTPVTAPDIAPYLKEGKSMDNIKCPAGGTYSINPVEKSPTCSTPKHKLKLYTDADTDAVEDNTQR